MRCSVLAIFLAGACHKTVAVNVDAEPADAGVDGPTTDAAQLTWTAPELVETFSFGNAIQPSAAIDPAGDIVVAWIDDGGTGGFTGEVWGNIYSATTGWGEARKISSNANGNFPHATIGPDGRAVVVWTESAPDDPLYSVVSARFTAGFGWSTPEAAGNIGGFRGMGPGNQLLPPPPAIVSTNTNGHILIAYPTRVGVSGTPPGPNDAVVNKYDPATGWGTAHTALTHPVFLVSAAIDFDGFGLLTVIDTQNSTCDLVREVAGVGWATLPLEDIGNLGCVDRVAGGTNGATIMTAGDIAASGSGLDFDVKTIDETGARTTTLLSNITFPSATILAIGPDATSSVVIASLANQGTKEWRPVMQGAQTVSVMDKPATAGAVVSRIDHTFGVLLAAAKAGTVTLTRLDAHGTWHVDETMFDGACPSGVGPPLIPMPFVSVAIADTDRAVAVWSAAPVSGGPCNIYALRLR